MRPLPLVTLLLLTGIMAGATPASATEIFANWTDASTGTLGGVGFTMSGLSNQTLTPQDLSGSDFSAAPGSTSQQMVSYDDNQSWTITLGSSVQTLDVYIGYWRGAGESSPVTYTFNHPFTVGSGLLAATVNSPTFSQAGPVFANGILEFSNISSLTVTTNAAGAGFQNVTFGSNMPVPEPASAVLLFTGLTALGLRRRRA